MADEDAPVPSGSVNFVPSDMGSPGDESNQGGNGMMSRGPLDGGRSQMSQASHGDYVSSANGTGLDTGFDQSKMSGWTSAASATGGTSMGEPPKPGMGQSFWANSTRHIFAEIQEMMNVVEDYDWADAVPPFYWEKSMVPRPPAWSNPVPRPFKEVAAYSHRGA